VTTLGLKDAKDLAESAPARVRLGVSESRAVAIQRALVAVGAVVEVRDGSGAAVSEPEPEPARVDVVLRDCGPRKIQVIKAIRECTHLGLKEAKDLAETAGATIKADVSPDEAAEIERQLTAAGATVELRSHADESTPADAPAEVDVFLRSFGANKIAVIKEVRALTGLGLKEAKDLVESAPCLIREAVDLAVAEELQRVLTRYGAVIELR
jgi:large subunit ribosomal protein L7/L12